MDLISTLLSCIPIIVTAVIGALVRVWIMRMSRLVVKTRSDVLEAFASTVEKQFADLEKSAYVTLDYRMDGDIQCLRIPLHFSRVTEPLQGMRLQLVEHSKKETVYSVSTIGHHAPVRFHWHYHEEMEVVQVVKGKVTDVHTGKIYGPGEIWVIDPGLRHIADFSEAFCLCTVKPPLPFASQHPIQLHGIGGVYDTPEPSIP